MVKQETKNAVYSPPDNVYLSTNLSSTMVPKNVYRLAGQTRSTNETGSRPTSWSGGGGEAIAPSRNGQAWLYSSRYVLESSRGGARVASQAFSRRVILTTCSEQLDVCWHMRGAKKAWATRSGTSTRTWRARARVQRAAQPNAGCGKVAPRIVCPMPYSNRRLPITSSSGRLYIGSTFLCALPFDDQLPALCTAIDICCGGRLGSWAHGISFRICQS